VQQAPPAIVLAALRRFGGPALLRGPRPSLSQGAPSWPSGLTLRSSRPAYGGRLTLTVRKKMIEVLWYQFIQTWFLGLVATVLGRYVGRGTVRFPEKWGARGAVFLQVWGFTFLAVLAFGYAGYLFGFQEHTQAGFAEFLFPLIAGTYFARQVLLKRMGNEN